MTSWGVPALLLVLLLVPARPGSAQVAHLSPAQLDRNKLAAIDGLIETAIGHQQLPGAVVVAGNADQVLFEKAYGSRSLLPSREPMTAHTIFDVASLTKVVATTICVMILIEEGKIRLADRVAAYVPGFARYGKGDITIRHLLTHMSGLRPDLDLADTWAGEDAALTRAVEEVPIAAPDQRFIYSDINFLLLGWIVGQVSGQPLDRFAQDRIFGPLGMRDTTFRPQPGPRIAPTEPCTPLGWPCDASPPAMLRGVVHDPTARRMGGVAGHAGVFSTAADLARFCQMLLGQGTLGGVRILAPASVARMTAPSTPAGEPNIRGLGWDLDSIYSSNRGDLFPAGSFGHTGFTGTSLWIDPATRSFVVFLSNRVHPNGTGDVTALRGRVATVVAGAIIGTPRRDVAPPSFPSGEVLPPSGGVRAPSGAQIRTGIDVLASEGFARLRGRRVGLLTNHTGIARSLDTTIDLLHKAKEVSLVALFSPEHGIRGQLDAKVPSSSDERTGLAIHSLYGDTRRPTASMLEGIDTLVIDLQDVGARFYTYMTTLAYAMEEAAKLRIRVVVLDRPNPIDGFQVEGPTIDAAALGFTGYFPMPVRHGMTLGELARLFNGENRIGADLQVVEMSGWRRDAWFDETGLPWVNPSPNMRNLLGATLYPGIGAIEGTNLSVGRGTDTPFEQIGAPWIDGVALADRLNARGLAGIRFYPVIFTPSASVYANERCQGVFMVITDRLALRPVRLGIEIASMLNQLYGGRYQLDAATTLLGSRDTLARIRAGEDPASIAASWAKSEAEWRQKRAKYLLYF